jgi:hypothetical protein
LRKFSEKISRLKSKHTFMRNNFFPEKSVFYLIMWKNILELDRLQMKIRCTCIASWVTKAINTRPENIVLTGFSRQQWLHERPSKLRYSVLPVLLNVRPAGASSNQ